MKKNESMVVELDAPELSQDERTFLGNLPNDGKMESHQVLKDSLSWDELRFWKAKDSLVDKGYIATSEAKRGAGYYRLHVLDDSSYSENPESDEIDLETEAEIEENPLEQTRMNSMESLMADSFVTGIEKWVMENRYSNYFLETLSRSESRKSVSNLGKRPDVTLVTVETYTHVPNKFLEVYSFEVKSIHEWRIEAVFEAAAHLRYSHRSYLALQRDLRLGPAAGLESRIEDECRRLGLGLVFFEHPSDYASFQFRLNANSTPCNPRELDNFLEQISPDNRSKLIRWIR